MPDDVHETAPTQFVQAGDSEVAYRRFGKRGTLPVLLLNYFAANMDDWDPKITNGFAAARDVIIFDYPGIGLSSGATPSTVAAMTKDLVAFCRALGLSGCDIVGFSLGGMIAQQLASEYPDMVRRMILLGTGPRGGEKIEGAPARPHGIDRHGLEGYAERAVPHKSVAASAANPKFAHTLRHMRL